MQQYPQATVYMMNAIPGFACGGILVIDVNNKLSTLVRVVWEDVYGIDGDRQK